MVLVHLNDTEVMVTILICKFIIEEIIVKTVIIV